MNAPESAYVDPQRQGTGPMSPMLPPLSSHPAPWMAPRVRLHRATEDHWTPGYAAIASDPREPFVTPCDPSPLSQAQWLAVSSPACALIGQQVQDLVADSQWLDLMSGRAAPAHVQPYAAVYAGHQFGVFVPRLGDGRALNLGALHGWELQLKGAGPTPYARFADGRAVLRSSIREFLCSEAMHALGIPTTRALCLTMSPDPVLRETVEQAAVVCRLAPSFVRFGTFEYFASRGRVDLLERLVRHVAHHLTAGATVADNPSIKALTVSVADMVAQRTAHLMAQWMGAGFMHGVMNTDNFSILGLTIDYGPFGFMDAFDAHHICNHSDHAGRYRYSAQPQVGLWNVARLLSALHPLIGDADPFAPVIETYKRTYADSVDAILRAKLGCGGLDDSSWNPLLDDFYTLMQTHRMDYTLTCRSLCAGHERDFLDQCADREAAGHWWHRYHEAVSESDRVLGLTQAQRLEKMRTVNPKYVLRNWIAEEVIRAVRDDGNTEPFEQVFRILQSPYDEHPDAARYAAPPPDWAQHLAVSCSS